MPERRWSVTVIYQGSRGNEGQSTFEVAAADEEAAMIAGVNRVKDHQGVYYVEATDVKEITSDA